MFIEKISIKSFGALKDYECEYGNGVNIIEGPNESGKSSVGAFIKFIFFGLSSVSDGSYLSERKKYQSWDTDSASGSIELVSNGKRYRIERSIIPAINGFGREIVKTLDLDTNEECLKDVEPGVFFFGVDGEVFAQSAYISQTGGTRINGITVSKAIENMLFSGNELISTEDAGRELENARNQLLFRNKKGGEIYELGIEKDRLAQKIEDARRDNSQYFTLCATQAELEGRLAETEKLLKEQRIEIMACQARRTLEKLDALKAKEEALAVLKAEHEVLINDSTYEGFIPDDAYISRLITLDKEIALFAAELEKAVSERNDLGADKIDADDMALLNKANEDGGTEEISEFFESMRKSAHFSTVFGIFFVVFALLWGALGGACIFVPELSGITVGSFTLGKIGYIAIGVAALMLVLAVVFFARSHGFSKKIDKKLDYYNATSEDDIYVEISAASNRAKEQNIYLERIAIANVNCSRLEGELAARREEAKALCDKWNKSDSDLLAVANEAKAVLAKIEQGNTAILAEDAACKATADSLASYSRENAESCVALAKEVLSPEQEALALKNLAELEEQKRELDGKIRENQTQLARLEVSAKGVSDIVDEYDAACARLEALNSRYEALSLACDTLAKASENLRAEVSPKLSMQASEYMRRATSEKYGSISIGSDLSIRYGESSAGLSYASRESDYMSEGTKDLAYVSLRLALVSFLFKKELPPLVFDEAFARLDDKRLSGVFALVRDYAENAGQVFIFTSQKRDAEIMRKSGNIKYIRIGY